MSSDLATALWKARTNGGVVGVEGADRPASESDAYALQSEVAALFDSEVVGWKLGATNENALNLLGLERPFAGPLLAAHFHGMGDPLSVYAEHRPRLETEFLVALGTDLPPRDTPYTDDEVKAAVEYVCPAFEVVGCRTEEDLAEAGLLLIGDGAVNIAVIRGEPTASWRDADLSDHPLSVTINGAEAATGSSNLLMWGNPYAAVAYLLQHPLVAKRGLRAGECIITGTCGGLLPLKSGDKASADFGVLGSVRLEVA
jgi:2-keto-4-pentenoate hydratase